MDITGNLLFCTYKVAYDYKDFISWLAKKMKENGGGGECYLSK